MIYFGHLCCDNFILFLLSWYTQHNGVDLLAVRANDPCKYSLSLMDVIFTIEEMATSCYEETKRSKERVKLLEGMLKALHPFMLIQYTSAGTSQGSLVKVCATYICVPCAFSKHSPVVVVNLSPSLYWEEMVQNKHV